MKDSIAVFGLTASLGIVILGVDSSGAKDYVQWRWSNEKNVHKSAVKDVKGSPCFRVNRNWISLDECIRS